MKDLYEGLPAIDRAELNGNVTVTYTEDGQENRSQERFDVVVRDRMAYHAGCSTSSLARTVLRGPDVGSHPERERFGNASGSLASAFSSRGVLRAGRTRNRREAASIGLFNRDKRKSFVNLSRKEGFTSAC